METVEWAVLAGLIVGVLFVAIALLGANVEADFQKLVDATGTGHWEWVPTVPAIPAPGGGPGTPAVPGHWEWVPD